MKQRILQITSGRGPTECAYAVDNIVRLVEKEAAQQKINCIVRPKTESNSDSVFIELGHENMEQLNTFIQSWVGSIQWICTSPFRPKHKRKNWFIGVFETHEAETTLVLEEKEVVYQAIRSSGAGGQHVNKVSSAVRVTHLPSGIHAVAMDSRSQHQNKKLAKERLLTKLEKRNGNVQEAQEKQTWLNQLQIERGNPTRVFVGLTFKKKGSL